MGTNCCSPEDKEKKVCAEGESCLHTEASAEACCKDGKCEEGTEGSCCKEGRPSEASAKDGEESCCCCSDEA